MHFNRLAVLSDTDRCNKIKSNFFVFEHILLHLLKLMLLQELLVYELHACIT